MFKTKSKSILSTSGITIALGLLLLASQPSHALMVGFQQAGNACFPRVFAQLDFFKMSNGGLRNDSSTPKTIVCSFNVLKDNTIVGSVNRHQTFIVVDSLSQPMDCTVQARSSAGGTNTVIDSTTIAIPAGTIGQTSLESNLETPGTFDGEHLYVQCKLPPNGRVLGITGAYFE